MVSLSIYSLRMSNPMDLTLGLRIRQPSGRPRSEVPCRIRIHCGRFRAGYEREAVFAIPKEIHGYYHVKIRCCLLIHHGTSGPYKTETEKILVPTSLWPLFQLFIGFQVMPCLSAMFYLQSPAGQVGELWSLHTVDESRWEFLGLHHVFMERKGCRSCQRSVSPMSLNFCV